MFDSDYKSDMSSRHNSGFQDDTDENADYLLQLILLQNQQMSQVMMKAILLMADSESIAAADEKVQHIPYHMSILTGLMWVLEFLNGHPD